MFKTLNEECARLHDRENVVKKNRREIVFKINPSGFVLYVY
jgi:hypothetical protein